MSDLKPWEGINWCRVDSTECKSMQFRPLCVECTEFNQTIISYNYDSAVFTNIVEEQIHKAGDGIRPRSSGFRGREGDPTELRPGYQRDKIVSKHYY